MSYIKKVYRSARSRFYAFNEKPLSGNASVDDDIFKFLTRYSTYNKVNCVVDVGAHIGNFTRRCDSIFPNACIYALEPSRNAFERLSKSFRSNIRIKPLNIALSDFRGETTIHLNAFDETNSILESKVTNSEIDRDTKTLNTEKVKVCTLDDLCDQHDITSIDILKIDVQGAAYNVIKGAYKTLSGAAATLLIIEAEFIQIYKEEKLYHHIACYLEELGYELHTIFNLHFDIDKRLSWGDAVFIKKAG